MAIFGDIENSVGERYHGMGHCKHAARPIWL